MMLVDACVWIDYLKGRPVPELDRLIEHDQAWICGTVLAEVISGVRSSKQRSALSERFQAFPYANETRETFVAAAENYAKLRQRGLTIPLSDCHLAAICEGSGLKLLTFDKHFKAFEDPKRFQVAERTAI